MVKHITITFIVAQATFTCLAFSADKTHPTHFETAGIMRSLSDNNEDTGFSLIVRQKGNSSQASGFLSGTDDKVFNSNATVDCVNVLNPSTALPRTVKLIISGTTTGASQANINASIFNLAHNEYVGYLEVELNEFGDVTEVSRANFPSEFEMCARVTDQIDGRKIRDFPLGDIELCRKEDFTKYKFVTCADYPRSAAFNPMFSDVDRSMNIPSEGVAVFAIGSTSKNMHVTY